jgi:ABC-type uncharacterized transport system substrate-binding protein
MRRRAFLFALVVAAGCGKKDPNGSADTRASAVDATQRPVGAASQQKLRRVAILVYGIQASATATTPAAGPALVRKRLTDLGYIEGETIAFDELYAEGDPDRLVRLAREMVSGKPDVIVTIAAAATAAVRNETKTIPIVMAHAGDPVGAGFAASLSRPGGNVTGTTSMVPDLGVKQVELLRELVPSLKKLGVLANPTNAGAPGLLANVNDAAQRFNISVVVAEVTRGDDFDKALELLRTSRLDALLVMIEPMIYLNRARVLGFAAANRLPASFDVGREIVRQGGLISYGPVLASHYALVADYVDKILKGTNPADLPIQRPTEFALVINLATARGLGLKVPQSILARADEVIQ